MNNLRKQINEAIKSGNASITWEQWTAILEEVEERGIDLWVDEATAVSEVMRLVKETVQKNRMVN
jgi:hypothetical protein